MRREILFAFGALALIVLMSGSAAWLANAPMQPKPETTRLVLPDERIPR